MKESIYIVMPAYNEAENIKNTVSQWYEVIEQLNAAKCDAKLIVANDGSKDDTYIKLCQLQKSYPHLIALDKTNSGHGATILYLYRYTISNGADYVFQTDSDGQTNPDEFWQLYENRNEYDFLFGYRKHRQDGISRIFVTKVLQLVVWIVFGVWNTDANTPFRLMKTNKLSHIIECLPKDFFLSNVAISAIALKWKYKTQFYKITFKPRQGGVNSINMKRIFRIGVKALGDLWKIKKCIKIQVYGNIILSSVLVGVYVVQHNHQRKNRYISYALGNNTNELFVKEE